MTEQTPIATRFYRTFTALHFLSYSTQVPLPNVRLWPKADCLLPGAESRIRPFVHHSRERPDPTHCGPPPFVEQRSMAAQKAFLTTAAEPAKQLLSLALSASIL
jgi:hypothetical protein